MKIDKYNLPTILKSLGYEVETEFKFCNTRKYRADYKISKDNEVVLVEYEGIFCNKSRHTSFIGYTNDTEKYNLMQKMGYKILRYTTKNINNILNDLDIIFKK
jgi:very-short-patch-repair endonuclease